MFNKTNNNSKYDLQERFVDFAVEIIQISEELPFSIAGKHISKQMLRSGTSPAANYGEAQSAESRQDFIHKLKIALKELRETEVWLKIISRSKVIDTPSGLDYLLKENNELISILFKSVETAKKNNER
jgi:four helix bundle protein